MFYLEQRNSSISLYNTIFYTVHLEFRIVSALLYFLWARLGNCISQFAVNIHISALRVYSLLHAHASLPLMQMEWSQNRALRGEKALTNPL